jgi:hypothetical protein
MEKIDLTLTEDQVKKLIAKRPFQLKHTQIKDGMHPNHLIVNKMLHRHITKAKNAGKGVRIPVLTDSEIEASGSGFMDILRKIKDGAVAVGSFVKRNVIDTPVYQSIKPEIRKIVDSGESALSNVLPAPAAAISKTLIDAIGQKTGAYGLIQMSPDSKVKPTKKAKPAAKKVTKKTMIAGSFNIN